MTTPIGGIAFFLSFPCLLYVCIANFILIPTFLDISATKNLSQFGAGFLVGVLIASFYIKDRLSVFIHELEHSIVANLCGNKHKEMKYESDTGHYKYEYTKETEKYNALISLAPYFLPTFLFLAIVINVLFYLSTQSVLIVILGIGYGIDLKKNWADVSPIQTDFTGIRGGYYVGLVFVFLINIAIGSFLLIWVMQQNAGVAQVFLRQWEFWGRCYLSFFS